MPARLTTYTHSDDVLALAAKAAAVAASLDDVDYSEDVEEHSDSENQVEQQSGARLEAALAVNRTLHATLAKQQSELQRIKEERQQFQLLLHGRQTEEPARRAMVDKLHARLQGEGVIAERQRRESQRLTKDSERLEKRIETLNAENLRLSDKHREERTRVQEQHNRLRTLGRRERELAKQLNLLASRLNESLGEAMAQGAQGHTTDFRNLPGLCLSKLTSAKHLAPPPEGENLVAQNGSAEKAGSPVQTPVGSPAQK